MPKYWSPGIFIEEIGSRAKPIEGVVTSVAAFVGMATQGSVDTPVLVTAWEHFVQVFGRYEPSKAPHLAPSVYGFFANGGRKCFVVRVKDGAVNDDYIGIDGGVGNKTGLRALEQVDEVNIVCIPGITSKAVQTAMIAHCEGMKDRFCILDPSKEADLGSILSQRNGIVSTRGYAALYYPWIKSSIETINSGKVTFAYEYVPPSGYIAGLYARNDTEGGVHKAPANKIVRGALDLKVNISVRDQDSLSYHGINCIRAFPGKGILAWGARTIASEPEWKYVSVRRLIIYLEESISDATRWVVFEPNDETLWVRVKNMITDFLTQCWRDGALMGAKPEEAFFVKCDRTTMTQADIGAGKFMVLIGVAPLKPAEYMIFRISHWTGGSSISE